MTRDMEEMNLATLAAHTKTPARTIRLYISMGLLPGPLRAGRNAAYGELHVERLSRIAELRRQGMTLHQARRTLNASDHAAPSVPATRWRHYLPAPDVQVMLSDDVPPWRAHALQTALEQFVRLVNTDNEAKEQEHE